MKVKDIRKCALFLSNNCPNKMNFIQKYSCEFYRESYLNACLKCWADSLELGLNKDKLEDEIDI